MTQLSAIGPLAETTEPPPKPRSRKRLLAIALGLGVLLAGIVALNVVTLSLSASAGHIEGNIQALDEENSFLRSREARVSGAARVRHDAAALGLTTATTDGIGSVTATPRDAQIAAQRLAAAAGGY